MANSVKQLLFTAILLLALTAAGIAQNTGLPVQQNEGLIIIANQSQLADTLNVWGDVRNAGKYLVPRNTSLTDLISYAHGPVGTSNGGSNVKLRVYVSHYNVAAKQYQNKTFKLKLGDPLPAALKNYPLYDGDVISVKTKSKKTFKDYFTIVAPLISLGLTAFIAYDRINRR